MPTLVLTDDELEQVKADVETRYRPSKFRTFIPVDSTTPEWADSISFDTIKDFAELTLIDNMTTDLPMGTEEKTTQLVKLYKWGAAVGWNNDEITRARQLGVPIDARRPAANLNRAEQMLESMAAVGGTSGTTTKGLLNQTGAVEVTSLADGWTTGKFEVIFDDLILLMQACEANTLGYYPCNTIVMAEKAYNVAQRCRENSSGENQGESVLELFARVYPGVRVVSWKPADTAGASSKTRVLAYNNAQEVARMLIPRELTTGQQVADMLGVKMAQTMAAGGVVSDTPEAIAYADNVLSE
jgi:hypothetical protein